MKTKERAKSAGDVRDVGRDLRQKLEERIRELSIANEALRSELAERRLAVESIKKAEDRIRIIIDTIPTMAWSLRPDGVVDFLSQRWTDYAGLSLDEYVQDPTGPIHPEDVPKVLERWRASMAAGRPYEDEMRLRRADGKYRWFLVRTAPLRDEQGNIIQWFGTSTDIEDRKRTEDALKQSEVDLAEAQRVARIGSWNLDLETGDVRWSEELYRIFEIEKSSLGRYEDFLSRVCPEDRTRVSQANAEAKSRGKPFEIEYRITTASGQLKAVREVGFARMNETSDIVSLFGTAQDVTERKRAERNLEEAHRRLKILSRRRINVQEEERRHLARELHDEIGQALTASQINLQAALREPGPAKSKRIRETTAILEGLLDQVRRISLNLRPSTLDDLGLIPALRSLLHERGRLASVAVRFAAKNVPEKLDPETQITCYRIAQEAITNTIRHAQATEINVSLSQEKGALLLQIRDNGRGFDAESMQAQTNGLGLLGMKERAALVGGHASISSSPGMETIIEVSLPLKS